MCVCIFDLGQSHIYRWRQIARIHFPKSTPTQAVTTVAKPRQCGDSAAQWRDTLRPSSENQQSHFCTTRLNVMFGGTVSVVVGFFFILLFVVGFFSHLQRFERLPREPWGTIKSDRV